MRATCSTCQSWAGAPDASMGLCRLHRDCHTFTATGGECWCPSYTPIDTPDISTQAPDPGIRFLDVIYDQAVIRRRNAQKITYRLESKTHEREVPHYLTPH